MAVRTVTMLPYMNRLLVRNMKGRFLLKNRARRFSSWKHIPVSNIDFAVGNEIMSISSGELARFADAGASARLGGTVVLAVLVWKDGTFASSFLPLTVSFRQKLVSLGRIPGSVDRRDRFETTSEILTSRLIDRSLRPIFTNGICPNIEINCTVLSDDYVFDPDVLAINAASVALGLSSLPIGNSVGAVRIACNSKGNLLCNPAQSERYDSDLDLVVAADVNGRITAIQACANNTPKSLFVDALKMGCKEATSIAKTISSFTESNGKTKIDEVSRMIVVPEEVEKIYSCVSDQLFSILSDESHDKITRDQALKEVKEKYIDDIEADDAETANLESSFLEVIGRCIRRNAIDNNRRSDGRSLDEIRPISCDAGLLPTLHGSSLFTRGQTQVLCRLSFDSILRSERLDPLSAKIRGQLHKNFMLHYEFPQFSTGNLSTGRGINRRELGHGNLAEMGIAPIIPKESQFAVKLLAEVLESNGSSSMATICAASLALMDGGVDISEPAAGVAIGLLSDRDSEGNITAYRLLTDILGFEDFYGEMDFKLAATRSGGITALQCDVKKGGLPFDIAVEAIDKGLEATTKIIKTMDSTLAEPRRNDERSNMPAVGDIEIPKFRLGAIFGPSRLYLKHLENRGVVFTVTSETNISIFAPNRALLREAMSMIEEKLKSQEEPDYNFGQTYKAIVDSVKDTGVYVKLHPSQQKPAFISCGQLDAKNILHPSAIGISEGSQIMVKYFGRDPDSGKMRLSRRALLVPGSSLPNVDLHNSASNTTSKKS